jgi:hypothetical protein
MSTEVVQLINLTLFAIVIALVFALGALKAASISEKDYRRRSREHRRTRRDPQWRDLWS